ncbi:MAG: type II secretion system protein [Ilumatobacter sp.]|nr:type II secretion system protein [Ilumatobacter sp.]
MPPTEPHRGERARPARRDSGVTFIEILVAVVLLGIGGVATLVALTVSIKGSDQHRSKVNAIAELEGAGAYLARTEYNSNCSTPPTPASLTLAAANRPGVNNGEITVTVTNVDCSGGLPLITLEADSARGHALESLDVVIGGISVLQPEGASSSGPTCTWGSLTATPPTVNVHTSGANAGKLKSNATISLNLNFSGPCSGPVTATISSPSTGSFTKDLTQDPLDPQLLNATLQSDEIYWQPDTYTVTTPAPSSASTTFVVG